MFTAWDPNPSYPHILATRPPFGVRVAKGGEDPRNRCSGSSKGTASRRWQVFGTLLMAVPFQRVAHAEPLQPRIWQGASLLSYLTLGL